MSNPTRDDLGEAHRLLKEQVARYGLTPIKKLYFRDIAQNTLKNLLKGNPHGKAAETTDALMAFHRAVVAEIEAAADQRFYHVLKNRLQCGDQQAAQKYVGRYVCYRFQSGTRNIIIGSIDIKFNKEDNSYFFNHTSYNSSMESAEQELKNTGPFYVLENRVYFITIGTDAYGAILRPIIARAAQAPSTVPLRGVVLTESFDGNIPVAARTVLYHEDLHRKMATGRSKEALEAVVVGDLETPVENRLLRDGGIPLTATNLMGW